ncbi:MAG: hypothetical protein R6U04_09290 [Bacteroidales bacterium]
MINLFLITNPKTKEAMKQNKAHEQDLNEIFSQLAYEMVLKKLVEIKDWMPFLINIPKHKRKGKNDISDGRIPFVQKALEYARKDPDPLPRNIDVDKLEINLNAVLRLRHVFREVKKLLEAISDTFGEFGDIADAIARHIYKSYGLATKNSDYQGIDSIYNDLKKHNIRGPYKKRKE